MNKQSLNKRNKTQNQLPEDFWLSLSPTVKARIESGLADADAGRYSDAREVIGKLMSK